MQKKIQTAPTIVYPTSDGNPMAETDIHRKLMMDFILTLDNRFKDDNDVYVSGKLLMYYEEGNRRKSISPDVFVVFGVENKLRNTYLTWVETHTPDFVLEVASPSTFKEDMGRKKEVYASILAVQEYYIYDPLGQIVPSFIGYRLIDGVYQEIELVDERLPSTLLDLELGENEGVLRLFDPNTMQWLQTPPERVENAETIALQETTARKNAEERAENAETIALQETTARKNAEERAENAETIAQQETTARKNAESALAKALAELERLQSKIDE